MVRTNYWRYVNYLIVLALAVLTGNCVDPYKPPPITAPNRYLVVEGYLNGGAGGSQIKLSRTQNVTDFTKPAPETKATISVEGEGTAKFALVESTGGIYTLASATLPVGSNYRVRIKTTDGGEYLSDPIIIKQTPPIDSVSWAVENNGLQVYVNTHDPTNKTRYYRWEFEDTYEILTPYRSPFEYKNGTVVARVDNDINHCWRTQSSNTILLGSTVRLTQDVLQKAPILFIPATSPKLAIKYSILVKQYAQSPEAYAYWESLQKSTEQLGSLFDPLPSQVGGNLHSLKNSAEPVLGFLDGYSVAQRRVLIDRPASLPGYLVVTGYEGCLLDTLPLPMSRQPLSAFLGPTGGYNAVTPIGDTGLYMGTSVRCTDCRDLGTTVKPAYWP